MVKRLPKHCVEDVDRHGNIRIYFRKPGQRKVRLEGTPWTEEFMERYHKAASGDLKPKQPAGRPRPPPAPSATCSNPTMAQPNSSGSTPAPSGSVVAYRTSSRRKLAIYPMTA